MTKQTKVLVVDDEEAIRRNFREALKDLGYQVELASSGKEGLDIFSSNHFDLVLTDLRMARGDGMWFISELKERNPDIPIIVVSGSGTLKDAIEAIRRGAWDYITKPVNEAGELDIVIHRTLERVRILKENRLHKEHLEELVTERTRQLQESEERYRALFDRSLDCVFLTDFEGQFIDANQAGVDLLGYRREDIPLLTFSSLLSEDQLPLAFQTVEEIRTTGYQKSPTEFRLRRKEGGFVYVETQSSLIYRDGKPYAVQGIARDITERKRAEEEKVKLQAQLLQAQKLESIGRLAGGVAHDFNNMLGVIMGHAELALQMVNPTHPLFDDLQEICQAAERSSGLTRQLLAFARRQIVAPKVLDLNGTIGGMLKMMRRLIGEDIELAWLPGESLWPVKMDPAQLDQILANLCVNARDAISGLGKVTVETRNLKFDRAYCADHPEYTSGDYVLISVSDDGCGMDKGILNQIFEPFFTTKVAGQGTGLGLATVYGIVKQNNGFITVYSEPGVGTTFNIYLPRHSAEDEPASALTAESLLPGGSETILLVEDEPAILKMTTTMLKNQGYNILVAKSASEALRMASEYKSPIHLLMTDVVMPEMNGRDLAEKLLSICPAIKSLFMSGYTADVIAHRGVLEKGVNFIQKPFSVRDLAVKVREVLDMK